MKDSNRHVNSENSPNGQTQRQDPFCHTQNVTANSKMYDFFSGEFPYNLFSFELHLKSEIKRLLQGNIFQSMQHSFTDEECCFVSKFIFHL